MASFLECRFIELRDQHLREVGVRSEPKIWLNSIYKSEGSLAIRESLNMSVAKRQSRQIQFLCFCFYFFYCDVYNLLNFCSIFTFYKGIKEEEELQ